MLAAVVYHDVLMSTVAEAERRAEDTFDLVFSDVRLAQRRANELLKQADLPASVRALALRTLGLAAREQNDLVKSERYLRSGLDIARQARAPVLAASVRSTLALTLGYQGHWDEALAESTRSLIELPDNEAGRGQAQHALILHRLGRNTQAADAYRRALGMLRNEGDRVGLAKTLMNAGLAASEAGDTDTAQGYLEEADGLADELGLQRLRAMVAGNLGYVASRRGDLRTAMEAFEDSERLCRLVDSPADMLRVIGLDRASALVDAGLFSEAARMADRAAIEIEDSSNVAEAVETLLRAARVLHACGQHVRVRHHAGRALARLLDGGNRPGWRAQAEYLIAVSDDRLSDDHDIASLSDELADLGWPVESREVRLRAADHALSRGQTPRATAVLERLSTTDSLGQSTPVAVRVQTQVARASLAALHGDSSALESEARTGIATLSAHRRALGSLELRATSGTHLRRLAQLWLDDAMQRQDPWEVVEVLEATTAVTSAPVDVVPTSGRELRQALVDLRTLDERQRHAVGDPSTSLRLAGERAELEERIRRLDRLNAARGSGGELAFSRSGLADASQEVDLAHVFAHDGEVWVARIDQGQAALRQLGPRDVIQSLTARAHAATLHSLRRGDQATGAGTSRRVDHLSEETTTLVARAGFDGSRPAVIVAGPDAAAFPWGLDPTLRSVGWVVTDSLQAWMARAPQRSRDTDTTRVVLIEGPDLPASAVEIAALRRLYPSAVVLSGSRATSAAVGQALAAADVAHICAHGQVQMENPLLSALRLFDGPLWGHELLDASGLPEVVVLASCSVGTQRRYDAGELLGLGSVLLGGGAGSVVAPTLPINDSVAATVGVGFHHARLRGLSLPAALGDALTDDRLSDNAVGGAHVGPMDAFAARVSLSIAQ